MSIQEELIKIYQDRNLFMTLANEFVERVCEDDLTDTEEYESVRSQTRDAGFGSIFARFLLYQNHPADKRSLRCCGQVYADEAGTFFEEAEPFEFQGL